MLGGCTISNNYYKPTADFGVPSFVGGCPSSTPAVQIIPVDYDWLEVKLYLWHTNQMQYHKIKVPVAAIQINRQQKFFALGPIKPSKEERRNTLITVLASEPYITVDQGDGKPLKFFVPELVDGIKLIGYGDFRHVKVTLTGVTQRTFSVNFPDLTINGKVHSAGTINFQYVETTQFGGC